MGAAKLLSLGVYQAVAEIHLGTEGPEALEVKIDGAAADDTATGKGHLGFLVLAQERTQQVVGGANLLHILVIQNQAVDGGAVDANRVRVHPLNHGADVADGIQHDVDVADIGEIVDENCFVGHDGGCQDGERGILRAANLHFADQSVAALYDVLFHDL